MSRRPRPERVAVRNASDPKQVKRAKETDRERDEREANERAVVWNTYHGRAFTRQILRDCGLDELSMVNDPHWTAFNEGARNRGLALKARMVVEAPDLYVLMEQEHVDRHTREQSVPEPERGVINEDTEGYDASRSDD